MSILEPLKNQSEPWKSPGNLFLKKGTNPVFIINFVLPCITSFCRGNF